MPHIAETKDFALTSGTFYKVADTKPLFFPKSSSYKLEENMS